MHAIGAIGAICLAASLWVAPAGADDQPLVDQPYKVGFGDRFTTQVTINGQGPFELVLDTASSQTILFVHAGRRLGLVPEEGPDITVHGIADSVTSRPYRLRELRISQEVIAGLPIAILDDPDHKPEEPDGVLGIDVLEHYFLAFESAQRRLKLYPRGVSPAAYQSWRHVRLSPRRLKGLKVDFWFVDARYSGKSATTLLDLGSGVTIITWDLARLLVRPQSMPRKNAELVRDALGKGFPAFRLDGLTIVIAGRKWPKQIALVADAPIFELLELAQRPSGIIGAGLLKDDSFTLDFEQKRLSIAPKE
jgi:hypothetical protein